MGIPSLEITRMHISKLWELCIATVPYNFHPLIILYFVSLCFFYLWCAADVETDGKAFVPNSNPIRHYVTCTEQGKLFNI